MQAHNTLARSQRDSPWVVAQGQLANIRQQRYLAVKQQQLRGGGTKEKQLVAKRKLLLFHNQKRLFMAGQAKVRTNGNEGSVCVQHVVCLFLEKGG